MSIGLHQLAQSAATAGQVPGWDNAAGLYVPGDVVRSIISSDASIDIDDSDPQILDLTVVAGGGSGGVLLLNNGAAVPGGTAAGTIIFEKAPAPTVYDFKLGALPAGWAGHNTPANAFDGAGMTATLDAADGYHIATVPAGDFSVEMAIVTLTSAGTMMGPAITNGAGTGQGAAWYNAPAGCLGIGISAWSYASAFVNNGGTFANPSRLRVRKSGTLYFAGYSFDGGATWTESLSQSNAFTPTTIALNSAFGSNTVKISEVVVRLGASSGKALGWWDGAAIQPLN